MIREVKTPGNTAGTNQGKETGESKYHVHETEDYQNKIGRTQEGNITDRNLTTHGEQRGDRKGTLLQKLKDKHRAN